MSLRPILGCFLLLGIAFVAPRARAATFHYQPAGAIFGDPIPFYNRGRYHVFFLHRKLGPEGKVVTPVEWHHLVSTDLIHWTETAPALLPDENDLYVATGSIVEHDGLFYAFYSTAQAGVKGPGAQSVRLATSKDLVTWKKEPSPPLLWLKRDVSVTARIDPFVHWRDPHVFWNPFAGEWWLAVAAQEKLTPSYPYGGAIGLATSRDLRTWTVRPEPLLASREGPAGECPDVFPLGAGWALASYTDTTRIRLSDTPAGPWHRPRHDAPAGPLFNAAKTLFDGRRRILFAFLPRVATDFATDEYGGVMALPRELYLDAQGAPAVRLVDEVIAACREPASDRPFAAILTIPPGDPVQVSDRSVTLAATAGRAALATWADAPADVFLTADVTLAREATLTLLLRGTARDKHPGRQYPSSLDDSYALTLDAQNQLVTLRRQEGPSRSPALRSQAVELPVDRPFKLHVMLHGDVLEAFVNDTISLSARIHLPSGALALLAREGPAKLENLRLTRLPGEN